MISKHNEKRESGVAGRLRMIDHCSSSSSWLAVPPLPLHRYLVTTSPAVSDSLSRFILSFRSLARSSHFFSSLRSTSCTSSSGYPEMPRRKRLDEESVEDLQPQDPECASSLYQVLGVEKSASQEEIRKAYHKLALRLHPDKNPGDENAKEKFQSLQGVIAILGDPAKRKVYDQTGSIDDAELSSETVQNLYEFFRTFYRKVTEKDIEEFGAAYRGSGEEQRDLKELYTKCKGNMDRVFDRLICSIPKQDSHRFKDIIDGAISAGELKVYKAYRNWATQVSKKPPPSNPLISPTKKKKSSMEADSDIMAIISERGKQRIDNLTAALEAKYAANGNSRKGKGNLEEPSEEEFEAARQRILLKSAGKKK